MGSLDIERFLDLGIRREEEVDEDGRWNEQGKECICPLDQQRDKLPLSEERGPLTITYLRDAASGPML